MACLRTKLHFLANDCVLGQNARKETLLKIQFYYIYSITPPKESFSRAWKWHGFDFGLIFTHLHAIW